MKFIIRKVEQASLVSWYLVCGKGKRFEWATAAKATRFDDVGAAALRAEHLGLAAHAIMVEAVSS